MEIDKEIIEVKEEKKRLRAKIQKLREERDRLRKLNHKLSKSNNMTCKVTLEEEVNIRRKALNLGFSISEYIRGCVLKDLNEK